MESPDRPTSITVPTAMRQRLPDHPVGGKSVAEAVEDLMDQVPPEHFHRDLHRALEAKPRVSLSEFRRRHRAPHA
jgi:hypothetical protein